MDLEKTIALGKELGYKDAELREWVKSEQARLREERLAEREAVKEAAERAREEAQREKEASEREQKTLEMKIRLQELARDSAQVDRSAPEPVASGHATAVSPHKLIPPSDDRRDDLDAYLVRFERIALSQKWPESEWAVALSMCLAGEALTVIGRMTPEDSLDYRKVKLALLQRFRFTSQGYNEKFRNAKAEDGETGVQFVSRLAGYLDRWLEMSGVAKTFDELQDRMIGEQFMKCCHTQLAVFIKERNCKTTKEMAEACDHFMEAQDIKNLGKARDEPRRDQRSDQAPKLTKTQGCFICGKLGHRASDCRMSGRHGSCGKCGKPGHRTENCRGKEGDAKQVSACTVAKRRRLQKRTPEQLEKSDSRINKFLVENLPVVTGEMYGKRISVLRNSGSNTVIVRRDLVPDSCLTGQASSVVFVDKTAQQLQEAYVKVHTPYFSGMLLVKCMQDPLYDLVLGNIPGARPPNDPDWKWHPHVDEAKTTPESYQERAQSPGSSNTAMDSQKLVAVAEIDRLPTGSFNIAEVTRDELKEKQEQDDSLKDCFRKGGQLSHPGVATTTNMS